MGWLLFLLAVAGGVAFVIWNFHRKTAARKAASETRFEEIFRGSAQVPANPLPPASAAPPRREEIRTRIDGGSPQ